MTNPAALPDDYPRFLDQFKRHVRQARTQAARTVNTELLVLYWDLGRALADKQQAQGWGTRVIDRLAEDLRSEFPHMRGLSRSNLFYMRQLATVWPRTAIVQHSVGRLPWGHVTVLLDKLDGLDDRNWNADRAAEHGWSRNVLTNQIAGGLHRRIGAAPSNFPDHLPTEESDLAQQLVRDPYVFDFLNLTERVAERDLYIDLLFFNWLQSRFVVVELKIGRFEPEYAGKLGFYVSWVDENLRVPDQHAATIGILLCAGRNDNVVRYSLAGTTAPLAVANYTYDTLPDPIRELVPTDNELATAVDATWNELDTAHGVTDEN